MNTTEMITIDEVKQIWTIPGKSPPSTTTIWHRRRRGMIPQPVKVGRDNLYNRNEVIRLRNIAWRIDVGSGI